MSAVRDLSNAPIREALLDVRVDLPAEFSAAVFKDLKSTVGDAYPKMTEGSKVEANLQMGPDGVLSSESVDLGLAAVLFWAADDKTIAQFRTDGFTLNRLRPYTRWDAIFPEAMRLWEIYRGAASPKSVSKVGLRYINEFSFSGDVQLASRYLRSVPAKAPGASGRTKGFLTSINNEDETKLSSAVTCSVFENPDGSQTQVVFDIDVSCNALSGPAAQDLAPVFERLRTAKNGIFFESLTDAAIALFQ